MGASAHLQPKAGMPTPIKAQGKLFFLQWELLRGRAHGVALLQHCKLLRAARERVRQRVNTTKKQTQRAEAQTKPGARNGNKMPYK